MGMMSAITKLRSTNLKGYLKKIQLFKNY